MKTDDETAKPPLVLLTGFLGAGKTTTLNRVLGRQLRLRVGVIINELGGSTSTRASSRAAPAT
jgi:G3E family GTPase